MNSSFKFGRYADVLVDTAFKYVLGQSGKKSMISLLKTFLKIDDIADIEYIPTEDVGTGPGDKIVRYDIACKTSDDKHIIVEAQIVDQQYFNHRAMLYLSIMVRRSVLEAQQRLKKENERRQKEGQSEIVWNYAFSPVYLLVLFRGIDKAEHSTNNCIHTYRMRDVETGDLLGPDVSVTFVELSKYERDTEANSTEHQWLYTLKHLPILEKMPEWIDDDDIKDVYDKADFANMPPEIKQIYEFKMTTEQDYLNALETTRQDAIRAVAEAHAKGFAEGEANGEAKRNVEIARAMKELGVDVAILCKATGLTEDEIRAL